MIEVISNSAEVAAARDVARQREVAAFLESLENPYEVQLDPHGRALLDAHRDVAAEAMLRRRDNANASGGSRMMAVAVLRQLGVETPPEQVAQILDVSDDAIIELYAQPSAFYATKDGLPRPVRDAVVRAVKRAGRYAPHADGVARMYRVSEAADLILARLMPGSGFRDVVPLRPTSEMLDLMERMLRDAVSRKDELPQRDADDEPDLSEIGLNASLPVVGIIDLTAATKDPALRERAVQSAVGYLTNIPPQLDWQGYVTHLHIISKLKPASLAVRMLRDIARGTPHESLRRSAVTFIHPLAPLLARDLARELNVELDLGKDSDPNGPSDDDVLNVLIRHEVISPAEAERAKTATDKPLDMGGSPREVEFAAYHIGPLGRVLSKLRRYLFLDDNGDDMPVRTDLFLRKLIPPSLGRFIPEALLETYTPGPSEHETGKYEVQFVHAGRLYRFHPEDRYTQFDVEAVIAAANCALADTGIAERFVRIAPDAVFAHFAYGDPARIASAAKELGVAVGDETRRS